MRSPATSEAIARTESLIGMPLPTDLRESLMCHNGGDGFGSALPCSQLFPADEIVAAHHMRLENWDRDEPEREEAPGGATTRGPSQVTASGPTSSLHTPACGTTTSGSHP
ncbi:SMI1/KNR4 family protein [Streptacidiphilus neutrinimicus]|uniref:SMI1/KNR4 family protein n=1 Tax=Streptacidiphilus neutrinimicus TaxID=105420 RepID=UPI0034E1FAD8